MLKQPNSHNCFACGLENKYGLRLTFYSEDEQSVVCNCSVPGRYQGYPGVVHGGVITAILDEVLVRAFMAADHDRFMYTGKLTVKFRKPVPTDTPLTVIGNVIKDRGRTAESKAQVFGPGSELLAEAQGLLIALPENVLDPGDRDALGWKVYSDEEHTHDH